MSQLLIVVDKTKDWTSFYPSDNVISVQDYLSQEGGQQGARINVINLCRSYKYLTNGYYCSLLAEARGHKVIPTVRTVNDLSNKSLYSLDIANLNKLLDKIPQSNAADPTSLSAKIFFGTTTMPELDTLARQIFELFPCPILNFTLRHRDNWYI